LLKYFLVVFYIISVFLIAIIYKRIQTNNKELLRKIIHIGMGPLIPIAKYFEISQVFAASFTFLIGLLILINYIYKLFPIIEDVERKSYGTLFYCLSLFILIIIFWNKDPNSLIAGFLIMTFGDGFAGLIGKNFSSKNWLILNQQKSFLGTITMFLTSLFVLISIGLFGDFLVDSRYLLIALIATILEQVSIFGIDNFTVPIISSLSFNYFITNV